MRCHQCQQGFSAMQARGRTVLGCKGCRYFWLPVDLSPVAQGRWVAANRFTPLGCPACEAPALRLGSVGNRGMFRCGSCQGQFAQHETGSAFAFFMEWVLIGAIGSDFLTCAFS